MATPFDAITARLYLEAHGISTAKIQTEAYLRRLYNAARKAEAAGKSIPSRSSLRGHPTPAVVKHVPADKAKRYEHYYIRRTRKQEELATLLREQGAWDILAGPETRESKLVQFQRSDIRRLIKQVGKRPFYPFVVTGYVKKYPGWSPSEDNPIKHIIAQTNIFSPALDEWFSQKDEENALQLCNMAFAEKQIEWVDIQMISIPIVEKKHEK